MRARASAAERLKSIFFFNPKPPKNSNFCAARFDVMENRKSRLRKSTNDFAVSYAKIGGRCYDFLNILAEKLGKILAFFALTIVLYS
jgi:hypothetical protein